MAERWALVEPGMLTGPGEVVLEGEEARHLTTVLRCRAGEAVVLADGDGWVGTGTITAVGRGRVEIRLSSSQRRPRPEWGVSMALAALHTQAMDWAVQKAVEVGVVELIPVVTERSQLSLHVAGSRLARWRKIARQALKQCRRDWGMRVEEPVLLHDLSFRVTNKDRLVADPYGTAVGLLEPPARPLLLIGPEGGLTTEERDSLAEAGWHVVSLGPYTLRAETAVVVGATVLAACHDQRR
jgi:16S rRNA (uracil1498-N3)-methyltransferase